MLSKMRIRFHPTIVNKTRCDDDHRFNNILNKIMSQIAAVIKLK